MKILPIEGVPDLGEIRTKMRGMNLTFENFLNNHAPTLSAQNTKFHQIGLIIAQKTLWGIKSQKNFSEKKSTCTKIYNSTIKV